jgi:hypothetical protein
MAAGTMAGSSGAAGVSKAVGRAISRLWRISKADHWTGFPTLAGRSDTWVTGFVVTHLAALGASAGNIGRSRRFLARQRLSDGGGGWGYGPAVPGDADSTSWCLAALTRSPALAADARRQATEFLEAHLVDGGVRTYLPDTGIRDFIQAGEGHSLAGWTQPHADVTAAALNTGLFPRGSATAMTSLRWLSASQDRAGVLPAYWWRVPYYTGALALRAFVRHRLQPPTALTAGVTDLIRRKQLEHGGYGLGASMQLDAFSTALALECYVHLANPADATHRRAAVAALGRAQQEDGGWSGDFVLRIPAPDVIDPRLVGEWARSTGGGNSFVPDQDGVFATTLAAHALALNEALDSGRYAGILERWPVLSLPQPAPDPSIVVVENPLPEEAERCA